MIVFSDLRCKIKEFFLEKGIKLQLFKIQMCFWINMQQIKE